jgi:DNA-binding SARP family transcriptional activator
VERERLRQRLLHALEALSRLLVQEGRHTEAVDVAQEVTAREPLRESGQLVLVEAHLAEGNIGQALACFHRYRGLLAHDLGVHPGPDLVRAVAPCASVGPVAMPRTPVAEPWLAP